MSWQEKQPGLVDITILPPSQLETEQQAPFLGLSVACIGRKNSTQRRPSPKGPHQPLLKMEDFLPIMVEWEGSLFFCIRSFCSIVGIKVKKLPLLRLCPGSCTWVGVQTAWVQPLPSPTRILIPTGPTETGAEPHTGSSVATLIISLYAYSYLKLKKKKCFSEKNKFHFSSLVVSFSKSSPKVG